MKKVFGYMLMAPEGDGTGGAGGGEASAGGSDGKGSEASAGGSDGKDGEGGSVLDDKGGEAGGKDGAGEETGSLLSESGESESDGKGGENKKDEAADAKPEDVDAYLAKIKKVDFGDGEGPAPAWDDGAVKAVAPLFIKHKISDAAANEIIAAYGKHVTGQYKAAAEADRAVLKSLRAECAKRFGGDIKRFAAEGRRGGEHVFGKETFSRLARVEAFGSDPDIIEALAKIGRGLTTDGAAGDAAREAAEKSLAERMYGKKGK